MGEMIIFAPGSGGRITQLDFRSQEEKDKGKKFADPRALARYHGPRDTFGKYASDAGAAADALMPDRDESPGEFAAYQQADKEFVDETRGTFFDEGDADAWEGAHANSEFAKEQVSSKLREIEETAEKLNQTVDAINGEGEYPKPYQSAFGVIEDLEKLEEELAQLQDEYDDALALEEVMYQLGHGGMECTDAAHRVCTKNLMEDCPEQCEDDCDCVLRKSPNGDEWTPDPWATDATPGGGALPGSGGGPEASVDGKAGGAPTIEWEGAPKPDGGAERSGDGAGPDERAYAPSGTRIDTEPPAVGSGKTKKTGLSSSATGIDRFKGPFDVAVAPRGSSGAVFSSYCMTCKQASGWVSKQGRASTSEGLAIQAKCLWTAASRTSDQNGLSLTSGLDAPTTLDSKSSLIALILELQTRCGGGRSGGTGEQIQVRISDGQRPEATSPQDGSDETSTGPHITWSFGPAIPVAGTPSVWGRSDCVKRVLEALRVTPKPARDKAIATLASVMVREARLRQKGDRLARLLRGARRPEQVATILLKHCRDFVPTRSESYVARSPDSGRDHRRAIIETECKEILKKSERLRDDWWKGGERVDLLLPTAMKHPGLVNMALKSKNAARGMEYAADGRHFNSMKHAFADALERAIRWYCDAQRDTSGQILNSPRYHRLGLDSKVDDTALDCDVRTQATRADLMVGHSLGVAIESFVEGLQSLYLNAVQMAAGVLGFITPDGTLNDAEIRGELKHLTRQALSGGLSGSERLAAAAAVQYYYAKLSRLGYLGNVVEGIVPGAGRAIREYLSLLCRTLKGDATARGELIAVAAALGLVSALRRKSAGKKRKRDIPDWDIEDVLENPSVVRGLTPDDLLERLRVVPEGWRIEKLGRGRKRGEGFVLREYKANGDKTGRQLRWHPGGGHHGSEPYWRVIGHSKKSGIIR